MPPMSIPVEVQSDFTACEALASQHYENFSVISMFIPRDRRPHFASIYAFCRGVDDLGDEYDGDRLAALDDWEVELRRCFDGKPRTSTFRALQVTIQMYQLPIDPFLRLIEANRRDQTRLTYETFDDLRDYCRYSADPVGQLVLALFGYQDELRISLSDCTCTALQIANHLQDISRDVPNGRFYIPIVDLERFGASQDDVKALRFTDEVRRCIEFEADRARILFQQGAQLESMVPRRLSLQLRLYRLGGQAILEALQQQNYDALSHRPTVSRGQKWSIAWQTLFGFGRSRR